MYFKQFDLVQERILNIKTALLQAIQFSISTQLCSIGLIDNTLLGTTTPSQRGPESDGSEDVPCIPQSCSISGT